MILISVQSVHALYRSKKIKWLGYHPAVWVGGCLLVVHVSFNVYLVTRQVPVLHNAASGIHSCTGVFEKNLYVRSYITIGVFLSTQCPSYRPRELSAASAYLVLIYDAVIFALVLWGTLYGTKAPAKRLGYAGAMRQEAVAYFVSDFLQALLP